MSNGTQGNSHSLEFAQYLAVLIRRLAVTRATVFVIGETFVVDLTVLNKGIELRQGSPFMMMLETCLVDYGEYSGVSYHEHTVSATAATFTRTDGNP